jgi:opacity protein-like surface antigen
MRVRTDMKTIILRTFALIALMVFLSTGGTAQSKVGTTAAQFLGISVGPRAMAMGGAYVAANYDATSLYWNPGAFVQASKNQFVFSNTNWLVGTKFRWFGLMLNLDGDDAVGVSVTQLDYGQDEITTVDYPDGTGQYWTAQDLAVGVSYCRRLTDRFSIGGSAKYVTQNIWNESASNVTFDLGLLFVTDFNGLRLGMSMSNFGGDMKLSGRDLLNKIDIDPSNPGGNKNLVGDLKTDSWPMPLLFRVGVAMDVVQGSDLRVTVAADALRPSDNTISGNLGAEIAYQEMFFLRGGYQSLIGSEPVFQKNNQQQGLSLGAGVAYQIPGIVALQVDYAWTKFGVFGNLSTIGLAIGF